MNRQGIKTATGNEGTASGRLGLRSGGYRDIAARLTEEIETRRFKSDETLPSVDALSERFGVGEYAVRHALRTMAKVGTLRLVPHVGAVVCARTSSAAPFRILYYGIGIRGYAVNALVNGLRRRFAEAGCDFVVVSPTPPEAGAALDLSALKRELDCGADYVIAGIGRKSELEFLDRRRVPYAVVDCFTGLFEEFPAADAHFVWDSLAAQRDVVSALRQTGVKRVLEVDFSRAYEKALSRYLADAGFRVRRIWTEPPVGGEGTSTRALMKAVYADVSKFLRNHRAPADRPDAIVFMDDYVARGGLAALLEAGFRVPEDVKVVAQTNVGNEPFFPRRLTRWAFDFDAAAAQIAAWTLSRLKGRRRAVPALKVRFVRGETL